MPTPSFIAPFPLIILADICQPPRLFRPPVLFETREYMTISKIIDSYSRWSRLFSFLWLAVVKASDKFLSRKGEEVYTIIITTSSERKYSRNSVLSLPKTWLSMRELFVSDLIRYVWIIWLLFPVFCHYELYSKTTKNGN